jgi:predicted alpha/beta superfamily hydrolase
VPRVRTADRQTLIAGGRHVDLYPASSAAPLVVYHAVMDKVGERFAHAYERLGAPDCSLLVINDVDWNADMSPWPIPKIAPNDVPCSGGAEEYLPVLLNEIIPAARDALVEQPAYLALTGYSLAGMFALWAATRTDSFERIASVSGSLWYPDLLDYLETHPLSQQVRVVYLSLGERESHTNNPYLRPVEDNTARIERRLSEQGLATIFELNPGNHLFHEDRRMARGVAWMLEQ